MTVSKEIIRQLLYSKQWRLAFPSCVYSSHATGRRKPEARPSFRQNSHDQNYKMSPTESKGEDLSKPDTTDTKEFDRNVEKENKKTDDDDSIWIFGYGSLIWKTNFPFSRKLIGFINGFSRKFWQGSTDHRGVPGKPGRVVTLIPNKTARTWGVAYQVLPTSVPEVMAYLNHREKGGYTLHNVQFYPKDTKIIKFPVYVYIATESNEEFLGDAPMTDIAKQIATSHGPSGPNSEYLLNLAKTVREMGVEDEHLFELEKRVSEELINNKFVRSVKQLDIEVGSDTFSHVGKGIVTQGIVCPNKEIDRDD